MALSNGVRSFNLLVSCIRDRERNAALEVEDLIGHVAGDESVEAEVIGIRSLLVAETSLDPRKVIEKLRIIAVADPWRFQYTLKYTPVDVVVPTKLELIVEASKKIIPKIAAEDTFRITCNKRHSQLHCQEIIKSMAVLIERKVDLENPDKVLQIEIIGERTGLVVLQCHDVLSLAAP
ncbi:MAG: THUMP domain-containing protein [Promethearchaeati archaeon SRVP18_Atabeyarchaeia-1]